MIGKYVEYFLVCDECQIDSSGCGAESWLPEDKVTSENYQKSFNGFTKRKDLMAEAKRWGWKTKYNPLHHICPKCQEEEKNGAAKEKGLGK